MIYKNYIIPMECLLVGNRVKRGAVELLNALETEGISYTVITEHSGKYRDNFVDDMVDHGFQYVRPSYVYTSSMAAVDYVLWAHPDKRKVMMLGGRGLHSALEKGGFTFTHENPDWLFLGNAREASYLDYSECLEAIMNGAYIISVDNRRMQLYEGRHILGNASVVKMLEYATGSKAVSFGRGSKYLLASVLRYMQTTAENTIMVGSDFNKDILPAQSLGMETCFISDGRDMSEWGIEANKHPDYIVEDLFGLTR